MSTIINATTTNGVVIQPDNSGSLVLQTNSGTTALTIDTSQNVGIGTTSPGDLLHIAKTGGVKLRIQDTGSNQSSIGNTGGNIIFRNETSNTEHMRIEASGNVGIGTSSPTTFLTVSSGGSAGSNATGVGTIQIRQQSGSLSDQGGLEFHGSTFGSGYGYKWSAIDSSGLNLVLASRENSATWTERMRVTSGGEVYIAGTTDRGAFNLQCNGTGVWGAGAYTNGSDERIKENITPIDSGLDVVAKLNPVTYKYKEEWSRDQSIQTGFIAQDLLVALEGKNYVDGIVNQSSEYMSVAYQNIIPILTKAIQEQQTIINDLKARVETLEAKLG